MKKKLIGISCNIVKETQIKAFAGLPVQRLFNDYINAVILAGGIPILIPATDNKEVLDAQLDLLDGLIISGGYDINPNRYGEEPHSLLGEISYLRDEFEFYLLSQAMKKKISFLGICRGHQVLNVLNGGSLYQDISLIENSSIKHIQNGDPHKPYHTVNILKDSNLFNVFGEEYRVNSFHHLAIKNVAPGFKVTAKSKDGIVEAIEKIDEDNFLLGVQWHPEIMASSDDKTLDLFKYFISNC